MIFLEIMCEICEPYFTLKEQLQPCLYLQITNSVIFTKPDPIIFSHWRCFWCDSGNFVIWSKYGRL